MNTNSSGSHDADVQRRLKERREQLRGEIRDALLRADADRYTVIAGQLAESSEQSLVDLLSEVRHADVARDVEEINDIQGALARIDAGTYGRCVVCDTVIAAPRLEAYPTAKRCLPCQEKHEAARAT
jgi:DnaK suppressor protein